MKKIYQMNEERKNKVFNISRFCDNLLKQETNPKIKSIKYFMFFDYFSLIAFIKFGHNNFLLTNKFDLILLCYCEHGRIFLH